ncbi:MAG: DNA methyltransferase [Chloroflexi bacterium]|nr:DNA methyltransferase [Chloroflexota bacterium]
MAIVEPPAPSAPDGPESGAGAPLYLRRAALLEALAALCASPDLPTLRAELAALRAAIVPGGALRAPGGEEAVVFPEPLLQAELAQIDAALSLERARYYAGRLRKAAQGERTAAINEIDLNRWKAYDDIVTDSLWLIERRDGSGVHRADYWGNFVPQIPNQLLRRYTRRGDWVLDPFAGAGTTLIEAQRLGRNVLGVELQPPLVERVRDLVAAEPNRHGALVHVVAGDSTCTDFRALLAEQGAASAQLAILHPPYHDIIRFSDDPRDLSNAASIERFLALLGQVVSRVVDVLDRGRYLALVIGDKYARGEWVPLGFLAMQTVQERGFALKSIVVKDINGTAGKRAQKELWRYRALVGGFYVFRHEYLFLFRKR